MALIDELVAEIARAEGQRGARVLLLKDALDERLRDAARALDASRTAVGALLQRAERSGDPAPGLPIVPWGATLQKRGATLRKRFSLLRISERQGAPDASRLPCRSRCGARLAQVSRADAEARAFGAYTAKVREALARRDEEEQVPLEPFALDPLEPCTTHSLPTGAVSLALPPPRWCTTHAAGAGRD
jgi:hypothetical protein